jgi:hypothetical protein
VGLRRQHCSVPRRFRLPYGFGTLHVISNMGARRAQPPTPPPSPPSRALTGEASESVTRTSVHAAEPIDPGYPMKLACPRTKPQQEKCRVQRAGNSTTVMPGTGPRAVVSGTQRGLREHLQAREARGEQLVGASVAPPVHVDLRTKVWAFTLIYRGARGYGLAQGYGLAVRRPHRGRRVGPHQDVERVAADGTRGAGAVARVRQLAHGGVGMKLPEAPRGLVRAVERHRAVREHARARARAHAHRGAQRGVLRPEPLDHEKHGAAL